MTPDKIYIDDNVFPTHVDWDGSPINTKRIESSDIEYIRKDALLEWARKEMGNTSILRSETIEVLQKVIDKLNSM